MFSDALRRLVLMFAFIIALVCLAINLYIGNDLLYSAFIAFCVMLGVGIVLFLATKAIAKVLLMYLFEQKKAKEEELKKQLLAAKNEKK